MARLYLLVPAAMALLATLHMPYGYYQLLRLVVTVSAGCIAWLGLQARSHLAVIVFGLLALVYNPVLPLALGRPVWQWVNVVTAIAFLMALGLYEWIDRRRRAPASSAVRRIQDY